jgi:regulator of protease activity HflC (stomatin/prohibitin superfamily)
MGLHRLVEVLERHLRERPDGDGAGVVDEDIDRPEPRPDSRHQRLHLGAVGDVGAGGEDHAVALQLGARTAQGIRVTAADGDASASVDQFPRQGEAQAARAAGDQNGLPAEVVGRAAGQHVGGHEPGSGRQEQRGRPGPGSPILRS